MTASDRTAAVIAAVRAAPGSTCTALARSLGWNRPTTHRHVDRAIGAGSLRIDGGRVYVTDEPRQRGLVEDRRKLVVERRRDDCANLRACEWDWVAAHGSAQGQCPVPCGYFAPRVDKGADVSIPSTLAAHV